MKRLLGLAAALICLVSCFDDQGLIVTPPSSLTSHQWYTTETDSTGSEYICLWDFTLAKNSICFVYFDSLSGMRTIPQYTYSSKNILPYVCHKRGNTWILTVDDGADTDYYISDIRSTTAQVSSLDGYSNELTLCTFKVSPICTD
ncbi:MAG: hypothetical protein IK031_04430 [Bacteroidales bacterium]|nr:hypothetical protein [Bacteroidales bacterium]